ncbi:MAG: glycosyltransferase family 4 protein [Ignavibacteria bacterium]|jgi:glycosyltransferase involved in cell wall biosynthesis
MKVLWFSNTPAAGFVFLSGTSIGGGWLEALDKTIQEKVDLYVSFYYAKYSKKFSYGGTKYYPICSKNWKLNILKRLFNKFLDEQDLYIYLDIIKEIQPDIIHIHGTENPFGCILKYVDIPVLVSMQGNITVYHHKYFTGIEKEFSHNFPIRFKLRDILLHKSYYKYYMEFAKKSSRELKNLKQTKYILGRTEWDRRIMKVMAPNAKYYHCDETLREEFYNNIWKQPLTSDKIIIHTTNGNSFYKGFETLCLALHELNKLNYVIEWRVAGISEDDKIVKVVKKKLSNKFPKEGLKLLGKLTSTQLINKLKEAHIYVMPSHIENSPNNLCEAMILGLPCIGSFAGGTGSLLKHGEEGMLIQDGDPWMLAGSIIELIDNRQKAIEMGKNARIRALKRHDRKIIVNNLLSIYQKVINRK